MNAVWSKMMGFLPLRKRFRSRHSFPNPDGRRLSSSLSSQRIWITFVLVFTLSLLVSVICFSGQSPLRIHIAPGQIPKSRMTASVPFSYDSQIQTERLKERKVLRFAPVYKLELDKFQTFRQQMMSLLEELNSITMDSKESHLARQQRLQNLLEDFNRRYDMGLTLEDLNTILRQTTADSRRYFWEEGLSVLQFTLEQGITDSMLQMPGNQVSYFMNIDVPNENRRKSIRTQEDALLYLRIHLGSLDSNRELTSALFHLLRQGIYPNLTYDKQKTDEKKQLASSFIKPVVVNVDEGEVILEGGTEVTALSYEKLLAYRDALLAGGNRYFGIDQATWSGFSLTFCVLLSAAIAVQILFSHQPNFAAAMSFLSILMLGNLLLLRLFPYIWEFRFIVSQVLIFRSLPFLTPIFAGVILATLLVGSSAGILYALLIDVFFTLMIGKGLDFFLLLLMAMFFSVFLARNIIFRSQILRVSMFSGLILGLTTFGLTVFEMSEFSVGLAQCLAGILSGVLNGLLAIFLLSPLERIFHLTSRIRLQELSDFNHRLLRQLQVYAPGTYHHSLMVANIAEQAALEVGVSGLLCRVCALFHDLGKITKPEYFIENQMEHNPHLEKSPRISTLIIKSHVREGVEIARAARLPLPIVEMIQQHHGTTLIQYFYNKALTQRMQPALPMDDGQNRPIDTGEVDESFYRYDGPRPRTIEAAIVMLSDSVEAASRSLSKVTPQSVDSLVEAIFQAKIADQQLDECPITYSQVRIIRKSISSTLVNMLHSRISYTPKIHEEKDSALFQSCEFPKLS